MLKRFIIILVLFSALTFGSYINYQETTPQNDPHAFQGTIEDCGSEDDILQIEYINISPDPPLKGKELAIDAAGYLKETVGEGSYIVLTVKYGIIKILGKTMDLCEQTQKVDKSCPLEEGKQTLVTTVELPKEIPPGTFFVDAFVYTPDNRRIACLKAKASFGL